ERAADLDQLAARNDYLAALGQRVQSEEDGGGVVVDDQSALGADQLGEEPVGVGVALAALALLQVVFQVRILGGDPREVLDCLAGERRAPQVGVKNHARGVDHRSQGELD